MLKIFSLAAALIFGAVFFNVIFVQEIAQNQISSQCAQAKAIAAKDMGRAGLVIDCN